MRNPFRMLIQLILIGTSILLPSSTIAQDKRDGQKQKTSQSFKYDQYVMVTMKDGSEIPAIIASVKSKNKYYLRKIGGGRGGLVNSKFLRPMTNEELDKYKR